MKQKEPYFLNTYVWLQYNHNFWMYCALTISIGYSKYKIPLIRLSFSIVQIMYIIILIYI